MVRSACLPDADSLAFLCGSVRATGLRSVAAQTRGASADAHGSGAFRAPPVISTKPPISGAVLAGRMMPHTPANQVTLTPHDDLVQRLSMVRSIDERFATFAVWLTELTRASAVFVSDSNGLPMTVTQIDPRYYAVASTLGRALKPVGGMLPAVEAASTRFATQGGGQVTFTPCSTELGYYVVGVITQKPLADDLEGRIGKAMSRVAVRT